MLQQTEQPQTLPDVHIEIPTQPESEGPTIIQTAEDLAEFVQRTQERISTAPAQSKQEALALVTEALQRLDIPPAQAEPLLQQQSAELDALQEETISALDETAEDGPTIPDKQRERAYMMTEMVAKYAESRLSVISASAIEQAESTQHRSLTPEERQKITEQTKARLEKVTLFFTSVDVGKRPDTPLERMAQVYEYLDTPTDPEARQTFDTAMTAHMQELVERAFDQHLENPEQYVSHGFDHSLNVADYAKDIISTNEPIVTATAEKYGISASEAKFMLENIALFHDCGYPHVGAKAKAVHGIAGADLISSPKMQEIFKGLIQKPGAKIDSLNHDLRDAILFHSADKVEHHFSTKVRTTRGTFLTEGTELYDVISTFNDPEQNPAGIPRDITEIEVSDEATKKEIEDALTKAAADTTQKTGVPPAHVTVTVVGEKFRGRFTDLRQDKDNRLGLEYSERDATADPLHAIIRLADNMDMRSTRFSETQREPAFRQIYTALGDNSDTSIAIQSLESIGKKAKKRVEGARDDDEKAQITADTPRLLQEQLRAILASQPEYSIRITPAQIASIRTAKEAEKLYKQALVDTILARDEHKSIPDATKAKIRDVALSQNSESMRHFGGCEAVKGVELKRSVESGEELSIVTVTVDRATFEQLNRTKIQERSLDLAGKTHAVLVGVGEYQIWRAEEAYQSILVDRKKVRVDVVDELGRPISLSYKEHITEE